MGGLILRGVFLRVFLFAVVGSLRFFWWRLLGCCTLYQRFSSYVLHASDNCTSPDGRFRSELSERVFYIQTATPSYLSAKGLKILLRCLSPFNPQAHAVLSSA